MDIQQPSARDAVEDPAIYESRAHRCFRWRADAWRDDWEGRGWELVARSHGLLRTTMIFRRKKSGPRLGVRMLAVTVPLLLLATGAFFALRPLPSSVQEALDDVPGVTIDSDGDGLPDADETRGWVTGSELKFRTDPDDPDSDDDGLSDGDEAGVRLSSSDGESSYIGASDPNSSDTDDDGLSDAVETGTPGDAGPVGPVAFVVSDPRVADTDGDGVWDGDEFLLDMDPLRPDSDGDGLLDSQELEFNSDPTLANADDDSYDDLQEFQNGTDPLAFDLTNADRIAAGKAGLKYGDCDQCAIDSGLRVEQLESVEYLAGHVASSVAIYGDFRDVALDIWKHEFFDAGVSAVGLVPVVGDGSKSVAILTKFAKRGDRAERAVREVTEQLPLSASIKKRILDGLPRRAGRLPVELGGGPRNYVVYKGVDYIGITTNFDRRLAQHARAGRSFTPELIPGATNLSRGEARAIEQACIVAGGLAGGGGALQNRINSIDPKLSYAAAAVAYGTVLLDKIGATCPITGAP